MECNKDEATRSKLIAESKLEQKDFLSAKKFALKAQNLYPGLYGISHILTILDVHLAAENKISGEVEWYRVLGVSPSADDGTIQRQYRKLALMLHPDKNKSVGANGAFELISEAKRILSDKETRAAYNQRRGYKGFEQKAPTHTAGPSAPCRPHPHKVPAYNGGQSVPPRRCQKKVPSASPRPSQQKVPVHTGGPSAPPRPSQHKARAHTSGPSVPPWPSQQKASTHPSGSSAPSVANQFFNMASRKTSIPKSQNRSAKVPKTPNPAPPHHKPDTFWTVCCGCNTHFEYLMIYRSHTLLCSNCRKPFMALEIAAPVKIAKSAPWVGRSFKNWPRQNAYDPKGNVAAAQKPGPGQTSPNSFTYTNYQQGPFPGTANTDRRHPSSAEKQGDVVQQAHDNLKRSHTKSQASAGLEGYFKKVKLEDDGNSYVTIRYVAEENSDFGSESAFGMGIYGFSGTYNQPSSTRQLTPLETRKLLMLKAQKEILKKLSASRL